MPLGPTRTVSAGVDVDDLRFYYQIHGLDASAASDAAWTLGVPRFLKLFDETKFQATFYCVAADLVCESARKGIRDIVAAGHRIGNHTLDHRYALTRLDENEMYRQVYEGKQRLEQEAQETVAGFRAPGYHINGSVMRAVEATGHTYDSSVFSSAPYYFAKMGVLGLMSLRGMSSKSILGTPIALTAPRKPYRARLDNPYRSTIDLGLPEYPISLCGGFPLIGTAFTAVGERVSQVLTQLAARQQSHLTFEFHAVDLISMNEDELDPALSKQPDLHVDWRRKYAIFRTVLETASRRHEMTTLEQLAGGE